MSVGGAKHKSYGGYWDSVNLVTYGNIYLHAFLADGNFTTTKTFWTSEDKTGAVTSVQGGSNGSVSGYFDGTYDIEIRKSDNTTVIQQYRNVELTHDHATMYEDNHGTSLPAVGNAKKFQLFAKHSATDILEALYILAGTDGATAWELLWNGITTNNFINIKDAPYNATCDGVAYDTVAFQTAITDLPAIGGVIYVPGPTRIATAMSCVNKPIMILGGGEDVSIIFNDTDDTGIFNYDTDDVKDCVTLSHVTLATTRTGGGDAVNCLWPSTATSYIKNFIINNVSIVPKRASESTAYFSNGLVLSDCHNGIIDKCFIRSKDNDTSSMTANIALNGTCRNVKITNTGLVYGTKGVDVGGTSEECSVDNCFINYHNVGVEMIFAATEAGHKVTNSTISSFSRCIDVQKVIDGGDFSGNKLSKHASSSVDFTAIDIDETSSQCRVNDNFIKKYGSGGTNIGIHLSNADYCDVKNNKIDSFSAAGDKCIVNAAASDYNIIKNNTLTNTSATPIDNLSGTSVVENNNGVDGDVLGFVSITSSAALAGSPNSNLWSVSGGTGPITSIDESSARSWTGRVVIIRTEDSRTISDGGNLVLAGDFVGTANDTLTLIYEGAAIDKYYEIARSVN